MNRKSLAHQQAERSSGNGRVREKPHYANSHPVEMCLPHDPIQQEDQAKNGNSFIFYRFNALKLTKGTLGAGSLRLKQL